MPGVRTTKLMLVLLVVMGVACRCLAGAAGVRGFGGTAVAPGGEEIGEQWLLLIAIDEYNGEPWKRLECAVGDAEAVCEVLTRRYVFDHVDKLYNPDATLANIDAAIERMATESGKNDSVLIYYAGHGHVDGVTKKGSWIPIDGTKRRTSHLKHTDIKDIIASANARHVLLISDSCFAGGFLSRGDDDRPSTIDENYHRNVFEKQSRQVMTSGGDEPVADGERGGRSPFAYWLVRKLAEHQGPYLTPIELHARILTGVSRDSQQTPAMSYLRGAHDEGGEFVFFLKRRYCGLGEEDKPDEDAGVKAGSVGSIRIVCSEKEANVWWGSTRIGKTVARLTPLVADGLAVGTHSVTVSKAGFHDWREECSVREEDGSTELNVTLIRLPREPGKKLEEIYFNETDGSTMVLIPSGKCTMGGGDVDDESPQHSVKVPAFYVSKHEISNRQWARFLEALPQWRRASIAGKYHNGDYLRHWENDRYPPERADHPAVYVSWFAAVAYCEWAGGRLPMEDEWERAARGDKALRYPWGNSWSLSRCNSADNREGDRFDGTAPVGHFPAGASPYGVLDMSGNVWEWVSSLFRPYPYNPLDGREDQGEGTAPRGLRGGAWNWYADNCRAANRHSDWPLSCTEDIGVRLCIDAPK